MKTTAKAMKVRKQIDVYLGRMERDCGRKPSTISLFHDQAEALGVKDGEKYLYTGIPVRIVRK